MIISLSEYKNEFTPFLNRVFVTGEPAGLNGVGKCGRGPTISKEFTSEAALEAEKTLIASYIDSWVRGQLYLFACHYGFKPLEGCECSLIPTESQRYPLRAVDNGTPVNPMIVIDEQPVVNPVWISAPHEYFFGVSQDVLKLDGNVSRAFREEHQAYDFKINLMLHIPRESVCVERRPRADLTK